MPAPNATQEIKEIPVKIVGGTHYGRYSKISAEQTWNFIVSDGFLVPYAGYKNILELSPNSEGRGIYSSFRGNFMLVVIGSLVYKVTTMLNHFGETVFTGQQVGILATNTGNVYISENNNAQICITDNSYVYLYQYVTSPDGPLLSSQPGGGITFPFQYPGYVSFQNGRFIIASGQTTLWVLSGFNDGTDWTTAPARVGSLQTKPDFIQGAVPLPGGGNNILVFGRNVTELWQFVATNATFPYQRASTFNVDYGCINPGSIASLKDCLVWIGVNEQSGPVLMVSKGNGIEQISTDGIDYLLGNLSNPFNCTGFLYQQDGHLLYQFTFPDDNLTYAYDFETKLFFSISDENLNYHIARQIVYFNNTYYFVSLNGGNVYEFDTLFSDAEYAPDNIKPIPRIRITEPMRLPSQRYFVVKSLGFTIEQGQQNIVTNNVVFENTDENLQTESMLNILTESGNVICTEQPASETPIANYTTSQSIVYLSTSRDGGVTFGNSLPKNMNPTGMRKSRFIYQRLGHANDITFQLRFVGFERFVCTDGIIEYWE